MTKLGGWVGYVARTSRLDFGLDTDPDPVYQWDTKRKLFTLAQVCARPSAVIISHEIQYKDGFFSRLTSHSPCPSSSTFSMIA